MSIVELDRPADRLSWLDGGDRRAAAAPRHERRLRTLAPLVVDDGCDIRIRGGRLSDGVRVALLEWLPLTRGELLAIEGEHILAATQALAALVRPPTIWATRDAVIAARRVNGESTTRRERHHALVAYALTQVEEEHRERVRRIAARFAGQLPLEGLPAASATVAAGCQIVAPDDGACAAVAATQLARYAASAFVAEIRRKAAPTMT